MNYSHIKKVSLIMLATLACGTVMAQGVRTAPAYKGPMVPYRADTVPATPPFYSNFGNATCTGCTYDSSNGLLVLGPSNCFGTGGPQWTAFPFVAAKSGQVRRVQMAVTKYSGCTSTSTAFKAVIYSDSCAGPGTALGSANARAGNAPCDIVTVNFRNGPTLTAGNVYWLAAEVPASSADLTCVWWESYQQLFAYDLSGTGVYTYPGTFGPNDGAFSVQ